MERSEIAIRVKGMVMNLLPLMSSVFIQKSSDRFFMGFI